MKNQKVVLISGACGIIGSSIAEDLNKKGYRLVLIDKNLESLRLLFSNFNSKECLNLDADITSSKEIDRCIDAAHKNFGRIDIAIHAAYPKSKGWGTKFEDLEEKYLMEDINNQLGSAIFFSQRIIRYFLKQGNGNLIHFSSIQGIRAPKFEHYVGTSMTSPIEYSAIKAGIIAITKYLSKYYKNKNIRINSVAPGGIFNNQSKIFLEKYKESCNSKGILDSKDLSGLINFLVSEESRFINGQNIVIDDGWSL